MQRGISLQALLQKIASLDAPILQYRAKNITTSQRIKDLKLIRTLYQGKLIINDDILAIEYADGIHLGQEDLAQYANDKEEAIKIIRSKIGSKRLGLSTHNKVEILEANALGLDYIGLGAYRTTQTKKEARVGEDLLEIAKHSTHKVALIGGVKMDDDFDANIIAYKVVGSDLLNY